MISIPLWFYGVLLVLSLTFVVALLAGVATWLMTRAERRLARDLEGE
jgi:hypothetical protein